MLFFIILIPLLIFFLIFARKMFNKSNARVDNYFSSAKDEYEYLEATGKRAGYDDDVISERGKPDLTHLQRNAVLLLPRFISSVFRNSLYELEDKIHKDMLQAWLVASKHQEHIPEMKVRNVKVVEIEYTVAENIEEICNSECDVAELVLSFSCDCTLISGANTIVVDNYNTPHKHHAKLSFIRERFKPQAATTCPTCQGPIFGTTCITCGFTRGSGITGFGLVNFTIIK